MKGVVALNDRESSDIRIRYDRDSRIPDREKPVLGELLNRQNRGREPVLVRKENGHLRMYALPADPAGKPGPMIGF